MEWLRVQNAAEFWLSIAFFAVVIAFLLCGSFDAWGE